MQTPTARLLELLELLQTRPLTTGREIAELLEIDRRTVRRYVAALQDMDIPVEGQRGVGGGYRVRPGYRLPPLMLSDDEAVVVVLGLIAARRQGLDSGEGAAEGALAKIHRVLPDLAAAAGRGARDDARLHGRRRGPGRPCPATPSCSSPTPSGAAGASGRRTAPYSGERTRRELSPYGLVVHAAPLVPRRARPPPRRPPHVPGRPHEPRDAARHRSCSRRRRGSTRWSTSAGRSPACRGVTRSRCCSISPSTEPPGGSPPTLAELVETDDGTLLRMRVDSLDWMAGTLASLGLRVHDPRAGRAPDERARARRAPRAVGLSVSGALTPLLLPCVGDHAGDEHRDASTRCAGEPRPHPRGGARRASRPTESTSSVEEIAQRAGVGMGTLYRRFPTKHDLVAGRDRGVARRLRRRGRGSARGGDPWTGFTRFVERVLELHDREPRAP